MEESLREATETQAHLNEQPLSVPLFNRQMVDELHSQYEKAINKTGDRARHTILHHLYRATATVEVQTLSYEEFSHQFTEKIDKLEILLKAKND